MYYNESNFPIYLYKINLEGISSDIILERMAFIVEQKTFLSDFKVSIKEKENQELFGYLLTVLPSIICSNIEKFTSKDFPEIRYNRIKVLSNIRINIFSLKEYLIELVQNPNCESVKMESIINELITFLFQYTFIELSKCVVASKSNKKEYYFNITSDSQKYNAYINPRDKSTSEDRIGGQKNYVKSYIESFGPIEETQRKELEKELILMSKVANQKKRLKSIFDENIVFNNKTTSHKRNSIFRIFFKDVVAKFFFMELEENSINDCDVLEAQKKFVKRA